MHTDKMTKKIFYIFGFMLTVILIADFTSASKNIWKQFNRNQNIENFKQCSNQVQVSINGNYPPTKSPTYQSLFKPDAFVPFLLLIEDGNSFAVILGFELMPLALSYPPISEELMDSMAKVIEKDPDLFLTQFEIYKSVEPEIAKHLLKKTDEKLVDDWDSQLQLINRRITAIEYVQNPDLIEIKEYSIDQLKEYRNFIQQIKNSN